MDKIIKNTTGADIEVDATGATVPAGGQITIDRSNYELWATEDTITEVTADVTAGNLVINNGTNDLNATDGLEFLNWFVSEAAHDDFLLRDTDTPAQTVRMRTTGTFSGFTIDKPNGTSGFMSFMPNSQFAQIIAADPAAASGVNNFFIDADNAGTLNLNVLPGAGQFGEVNVSCNAPLRPDVDLASAFGKPDKRWKEFRGTGIRYDVTQTAHGFVIPSYGLIPVYYNNTSGNYEAANANDTTTAADFVIVDAPDANTITIQEQGFLYGTHGLDVGKWYILREGLAGLIIAEDAVSGTDKNVQFVCFVVDADTLLLRLDPIFTETLGEPEDIAIVEDWAEGLQPVTISAGTNRLLLAATIWEDQSGSTLVTSIDIGGQIGQLVTEQSIISGLQQGSSLCYWDEAQIAAMVGTTMTVNWSAGAPDFFQNVACLLENVHQTTPVFDTNTDQGTGSPDTLDADINTEAGGYACLIAGGGNPAITFTNNGTGWTRKVDITITSADGVVDDKLVTADTTPENVNLTITGSNRQTLIAGSFRRQT